MADATTSATAGSNGFECSMVAITDLNTGLGRRWRMTVLVKTFCPKTSPGASEVGKNPAGPSKALTASIACSRALLPLIESLPMDRPERQSRAASSRERFAGVKEVRQKTLSEPRRHDDDTLP